MKFWLAWFGVFLAAEAYALASPSFPTLSQTWRHLVVELPGPWGLALAAATGAALLWLLGPHWAWSTADRPGLDPLEVLAIVAGALWAVLGARQMRRRATPADDDDRGPV